MRSVCLNMIVKNEANVIRRCLASVRPFITHWVIVDTGSTDGTQEVIRAYLQDLPGMLYERPWKNFGHNRSEALALARGKADYILVIDADEELLVPPGFVLPTLSADAYHVLHDVDGVLYWRMGIISDRLKWRYVGVLHEYLTSDSPHAVVNLLGPRVLSHRDGGRSADQSITEKYARDAKILEQALLEEPNNSRHVFYLAQSYRDSGQLEKALDAYARRATMGGWAEEVWYSLHEVARLKERLNHSADAVLTAYLQAYQNRPRRAEPLCNLARYYREHQEYHLALLFARHALTIPKPDEVLFLDPSTYDWRCLDEYAVASYWVGQYQEAARACQELLGSGKLPEAQRQRVLENLHYANAKLARLPR